MLTVLTGRSRRLWPKVIEEMGVALAGGAKRLLLLTPDQYTLQAELELIQRLNLPGLLEIEVLSPSRLLTRVFTLAGAPKRVRVDARGKAMMLSDVLRRAQGELVYFGGAAGRRGFTDKLAGSIGDFKRAGMGPDAVRALAEETPEGDALRGKLLDIALVYERYEEQLSGAFLDGEDVQEAMLERLPQSGFLQNAKVWVYGFDLISVQFLRQIALMARLSESVRVALTLDEGTARDGLVFTPARDTLSRLSKFFDAERLEWAREHVDTPLPSEPEIAHLERELFAVPARAFEGAVNAVTLWTAAGPYDEAARTASAMLTYARKGVRFDDMALVVCDMEAYAGALETAFSRSGIPYHLARKRPLAAHPLARALLAALRCVTRGWRAEDALDWLKAGFSTLLPDEVERVENYAIENGLRGAKWQRPTGDSSLEPLRERFIAPLNTLRRGLGEARSVADALAAVYGLLEDVDAFGTLENWQQRLMEKEMYQEAADCMQAWRLLLETLDQLHALLGDGRLPMAALAQTLEAGLLSAELGDVPVKPGMVQVGQLGHVKLGGHLGVLFLLGLQDGAMRTESESLLSDAEASRAAERIETDAAFGLRGDALAQLAQVNLLDTVAAPSQRLFISYARQGGDGEAARPATVIKRIRRIFPALGECGGMMHEEAAWHAPGAALDALGPALRGAIKRGGMLTETETQAAAWLLNAPQTLGQAGRVVRAFSSGYSGERLPGRVSGPLYAHTRTSVSRLESFANCPFRQFVSYGLRPMPRRTFEVARNETGAFYHRAMEGFAKAAAEHLEWPGLTREENDALMDGVLAPLTAEWENTPLGDNAMLRWSGEGFCRIARQAAWVYAGQMRRGGFATKLIEARFGPGEALPPIVLTLPDGSRRLLEGRIDRIDFYEEDGRRWLYVVDYKSGGVTLDTSRVYGGLQLQLLLYLQAALAAFPGISAAGAFYSKLDDPLVLTDSRDREEIERLIAKALRLEGIAISDVRVLKALENGEAYLKMDGTPAKRAGLASEEELALLMGHASTLSGEMAAQIAMGEIAARPAQLSGWKACKWCDYVGICAFDPSVEGYETRRLAKVTKEEMLGRIGGDV